MNSFRRAALSREIGLSQSRVDGFFLSGRDEGARGLNITRG